MKDDYLWDGSGTPDPDIEQLEKMLGQYRHQAKPLDARFEQALTARRSQFFWVKYAAAAAIIVTMLAGAWLFARATSQESRLLAVAEVPELWPLPGEGIVDPPALRDWRMPAPSVAPTPGTSDTGSVKPRRRAPRHERNVIDHTTSPAAAMASELAMASPLTNPFVDAETARHIERAQVLLRSFRNTEGGAEFDLAYERQSSRRLLSKNILLRRHAEAKGNLPVQDLLGSLEPFLLDIANLPDAPSRDDVNVIKARMEKKEIISALQIYSAPMLSRAL